MNSLPSGPAEPGLPEQLWSVLIRTRLFLASYAPLALIFAARSIETPTPAIVWLIVAMLGLEEGFRLTHGALRRTAQPAVFDSIRDRGGAASGYLATYLLPFIAVEPSTYGEVLAYVIYFAVLWIVYLQSDLALINPTIYLFGWRIAEAKENGRSVILVCRHLPRAGDSIQVVRFLNVYVEKRSHVDDAERPA